jgi:transposase
MPRPYSQDLRERVIAACEAGELKRSEVAQQFQICPAALYNWLRRYREQGSFVPKPHSGGYDSGLDADLLRELVEQNNDRTLEEYARLYAEKTGRLYSISWLSVRLKRLHLSRKKKNAARHRAAQARDRRRARRLPS